MANTEGALSKVNIPKIDKKNFLHWSMQIKAHLQHKGLIKYINKPPIPLARAAANAVAKKRAKLVNFLMNYVSEIAFKAVITPENKESPFNFWALWCSIYVPNAKKLYLNILVTFT
jgi:hypothetical protein